jgi:hypothetical protein
METCEVIGWLDIHADKAQVLVREESGRVSLQTASPDSSFGHQSIQTGTFRRGNPIFDPVTHKFLGYEMESVPNPFVAVA